jgi:hypothetical protein
MRISSPSARDAISKPHAAPCAGPPGTRYMIAHRYREKNAPLFLVQGFT